MQTYSDKCVQPVSEKIIMVEDLWDGIAGSNAELPVHDWQKTELASRKQKFSRNPKAVLTWSQVKKSILVKDA